MLDRSCRAFRAGTRVSQGEAAMLCLKKFIFLLGLAVLERSVRPLQNPDL